MTDKEQEIEELLNLDLVGLMQELAEDNKKLPEDERLPESFFTIYIHSISQWHYWLNNRPKQIATFDKWAEAWGYNDIHFLRNTFKLTTEQEEILDRFEAWAMSIKIN